MGGSASTQRLMDDILADPEYEKITIPDVEPNYPPPRPHRAPKWDVFVKEEYAEIDERARQAPEELVHNWNKLIEYLTEGLTTDVQRLRSVFIWLGTQDIDRNTYNNVKDKNSPLAMMKLIKEKQASYAVFFAKLCRSVDVPCVLVRGYGKSVAYEAGDNMEKVKTLYNIWNTVFIQDDWFNVVPLWAFQTDVDNRGRRNTLLESTGAVIQSPPVFSARRSPNQINEYFFLTDPEDLGMVLYAKDQVWQLSKIPISFERFCSVPYMRRHYFIYQVKIMSQFDCCLRSDEGVCVIRIEPVNPKWDGFLTYKFLYDSKESGNEIDQNIHLSRHVIMDRRIGKWVFVVRFPVVGVYRMHIYGGEMIDLYSGCQNWICSFKLICDETRENNHPIPCSTGILGFGANVGLEQAGLNSPSHVSGIVRINTRQETELSFFMQEKIPIRTELVHKDLTSKTLRKCLSQRTANGRLHINVTVPQEGEYVLQIYTNSKDTEKQNICNYLLTTDDPTRKKKTRENPTEKRARQTLQSITETMTRPEEIDGAIQRFCRLQLEDNGDLTRAYDRREYLRIKTELEAAMKRSHSETIMKAMTQAKNSKYAEELEELIEKADKQNDHLRQLDRYVYDILDMKQSTISELHGYKVAQPIIHDVIKATYTMLGEKDSDLDDWEEILWLVRQTGKKSLLNRIKKFDVFRVKYDTIEAVQNILKPYNQETVRSVSAVAGTFYLWCTNLCDDFNQISVRRNRPRRY